MSETVESITLPDSIESIGTYAFSGCKKITEIHTSNNLTSIGGRSFEDCENLSDFSIPKTVTYLGSGAFLNCKSITELTVPDGITQIYGYTFEGCENLVKCNLPDSITSIQMQAFSNCFKLEEIHLSDQLTSVGNMAFFHCDSLKSIIFPDNNITFGYQVLGFCLSLTNVHLPDEMTEITPAFFSGCSSIEKITLPETIAVIRYFAFSDCSSLKKINMPSRVNSIEQEAFSNCASLTKAPIPESVVYIADGVFMGCSSIKSVEFRAGFYGLGQKAFYGCTSLKSVKFNDEFTSLHFNCFEGCTSLKKIDLSNTNIRQLYSNTFKGCTSLEDIKLKDLCVVDDSSFAETAYYNDESNWENDCLYIGTILASTRKNIEDFVPREGTTVLASCLFADNKTLKTATLPHSLVYIGDRCFKQTNITKIVIPENVRTIYNAAFYGSMLTDITINSVDLYICMGAFGWISRNSTVRLAPNCILKGEQSFYNCNIETLVYGEGTTEIDTNKISDVNSVKKIVIPDSVENIEGTVLKKFSTVTVYCNENSYAKEYSQNNKISYTTLVVAPLSDEVFCNKSIIPDCTVKINGKLLTNAIDYTITGENNFNVGTAALIIRGTGDFHALSAKAKFNITPKNMQIDIAMGSELTYNGKSQTPKITITETSFGAILKEGTDYTVSYPDDTTSFGKKNFSITGIGNYLGNKNLTYTISKADIAGVSVSILPGGVWKITDQNENELKKDVDYSIISSSVSDNTYTITLKGVGNFMGESTFSVTESVFSSFLTRIIHFLSTIISMFSGLIN